MNRNKKKIIRAATIPSSFTAFLNDSIELLMIKYELVLLSSPEKELYKLKDKYKVRAIGVPMERHISLLKDLKSLVCMVRAFRKEKPQAIHSMTPKAGLLCMIAAWMTRVPVRIHTFTGLVWPTSKGLSRKVLMLTDWITCSCATHVIPEGEGVKNDLQNHITKKPMKVLGYGNVRGIDIEYWSLRPEIEQIAENIKRKGVFTFLFVGRIVGDKGINELIEAFIKLLSKHNNIRLLLVGPYEESLDPIKQVTLDRINNITEIEAVGDTHGTDLLAYYAASNCFVFPSYREGFPNTVIEAGAMGLPSIVTDINGSREIVTYLNPNANHNIVGKMDIRDNGIVIPSKDVEALYEAMDKMIVDNVMREKMAENASPMIESRFEQKFVQKCLFDFYDEIIK